MKHSVVVRLAAVCALLLAAPAAFPASFVVPPDRDMVRRSHAIVVGSALTSYTQIAAYGGIETVTPFSIEEVIKGDINSATINVHEPGGKHGDHVKIVFGSPRFKEGDRVLLFLRRTPQDTWSATDLVLGKFTFDSDSVGRKVLVRQEMDISGWNPDGSEFQEKRRRADKFLAFVRAESAGGVGREDYFIPKDTLSKAADATLQPEVTVASTSAASYTFDFDGGGTGIRWNAFPSAVNFTVFNTAVNPARATAAVNAALGAWTNDANSNVNLVNAGADAGPGTPGGIVGASDNRNTIRFETDLNALGAAGPFTCTPSSYSGVLGVAGVNLAGGPHAGPTGQQFFTILEGDVDMNLNVLGCNLLSNLGDLTGGVTHEVGHALGFRHSDQDRNGGACTPSTAFECSSSAIMKSFLPSGLNGVLQEYDINAVRTVYPGAPCTGPSITAHPASTSISSGSSTLLSVTATGSGLTYQWYIGPSGNTSSPVGGATGTSLMVSPTVTTQYWVRVTNSCTSVNSNTATVTVSACVFNISPSSNSFTAQPFTGTVTVTAGGGCGWTAVSNNSFITITGGASGTGNGTVSYSVAANTRYQARSGTMTIAGRTFTINQTQKTRGDMNASGSGDVVWRNQATGANQVWLLNGINAPAITTIASIGDTNFRMKGSGDLDGDGKADIIFRNNVTNTSFVWFMDGASLLNSVPLPGIAGSGWDIAVIADFNADGKSDLLWHNDTTNANTVWLMNGAAILSQAAIASSTYSIKFAGDFNGDGTSDILLRNGGGFNQIWLMNGTTVSSATDIASLTDTAWEAEGVGEFDGDGKADILWRNYASGSNYIWRMDGTTLLAAVEIAGLPDTAWDVRAVTDLDGNGRADIMWRNYGGGATYIWIMNGGTLVNSGPLPSMLDLNWDIHAPK